MNTMKRIFSVVYFLLGGMVLNGQVVTEQLVAKLDVNPQYELSNGKKILLMGYTRLLADTILLPAPLLIYNEGDSIELSLINFSQPAPHTIHLHGLDVNQQNDGVPHLSFDVPHLMTGVYKFRAPHAGTYLYHCHVISAMHVQAGMYGMIIVKPPNGSDSTWSGGFAHDQEYAWLSSEVDTTWHRESVIKHYDSTATSHKIMDYYPQHFLLNGKADQQIYSDTTLILNSSAHAKIYLRLGNLGYFGNRVILPASLNATIISSDGRPLPVSEISDTVYVFPGERYGVLLEPTQQFIDSVKIEYINLNTQLVENIQTVPVNISGFVGLKDKMSNLEVDVFPNPASDKFFIRYRDGQHHIDELEVYNISGGANL